MNAEGGSKNYCGQGDKCQRDVNLLRAALDYLQARGEIEAWACSGVRAGDSQHRTVVVVMFGVPYRAPEVGRDTQSPLRLDVAAEAIVGENEIEWVSVEVFGCDQRLGLVPVDKYVAEEAILLWLSEKVGEMES